MIYVLKQIGFLGIMLLAALGYAQSKAKSFIIEGNEYYQKGKFDNAEFAYKKATMEDPTSVKANYNLGNALFQQKRYKESIAHYKRSAEISTTNNDKHLAYHNLGNAFMQEKDYQNAVDNYKLALKNDPKDNATRYNYALAKKLLQKEQEKQQDKNNKDQNNEQNQQNQNEQKKQQQNKQNENNQQQQKNQPQNQQADQQQQKQGGNPKAGGENGNNKGKGNNSSSQIQQGNSGDGNEEEQAKNSVSEGLLKALNEQEVKTQRKIIQQKTEKQRTTTSKDW